MPDDPPSQELRPQGKSLLAAELAALDPRVRAAIGLRDMTVVMLDALVTAARVAIDDADPRPLLDRVADVFTSFDFNEDRLGSWVDEMTKLSEQDLMTWAKRLTAGTSGQFVPFLHKLVGEKVFHKLDRAARADIEIVVVAFRRGVRAAMPFAVAYDDIARFVTPGQLAEIKFEGAGAKFLDIFLKLDELFDKAFDFTGKPTELLEYRDGERQPLEIEDVKAFYAELRSVISGRSRVVVQQLGGVLERKLQGARDALAFSADPVSQAATSIIELVDRLLRSAFTEEEVLDWAVRNFPPEANMTYVDAQLKHRPTKRAEMLCFTLAGRDIEDLDIGMHQMAAAGLHKAREELQKLKHADGDVQAELPRIEDALSAVEGYLSLTVGIAWPLASEDRLERLRQRLDPNSVPAAEDTIAAPVA